MKIGVPRTEAKGHPRNEETAVEKIAKNLIKNGPLD